MTAFARCCLGHGVCSTGLRATPRTASRTAPGAGDLKRIHKRYFMYVLPLFVIAMVATTALPRSDRMRRVALAAAGVAAGGCW